MRGLIALALVAGCAPDPANTGDASRGIDVQRVLAHVATITAIGPRPADSDGSRAAAGYIEDELDRLGLDVHRMSVGDVDLPALAVLGRTIRPASRAHTNDPNLVVHFGPPGPALLVMAHYDTVPRSPGAIDNATANGVLIELARVLSEQPPQQSVLLAFTAGEEIGLVGGERLAAQLGREIGFAISLDLLGGQGPITLNGASLLIGAAELRWIAGAADRAGVVLAAPLVHRVISRWWPQAERSDHGPFTRRGIRAVHLYNRGNDGEMIDLAYHSPADVPARIDRAAVDEVGRLLRALVARNVPAHAGDGFWLPVVANTVIPRWLVVGGELVLVLVVIAALVWSRAGLLARLTQRDERATDRPRGSGLVAATMCYACAIVVTIAIEGMIAGAHPAPWLHAPLRALVGESLVIVGVVGLATRAVARYSPWIGVQRYLAVAAIVPGVIGLVLVVIGAAEVAWIWLLPAAVIALAPRLAGLAVACAGLPAAFVLDPDLLREAAYHGFLPSQIPLGLWIGLLGIPVAGTIAWWLRRRRSGPLGTLVLGVGCGLAVVAGIGIAITGTPRCTAAKFERFHLACERV